jgi:hypothetical protein
MKTSMILGGIGPKLALLCLPQVIFSLIVMHWYPEFFDLKFLYPLYQGYRVCLVRGRNYILDLL